MDDFIGVVGQGKPIDPQIFQAINIALGYPLELASKVLLLKISYT